MALLAIKKKYQITCACREGARGWQTQKPSCGALEQLVGAASQSTPPVAEMGALNLGGEERAKRKKRQIGVLSA